MKKLWNGIGKAIVGTIGLVVGVVIVLALLGLIVTFGTAVIGIIAALLVIGIIVGGIRKLFGIKSDKNIIELNVKKDGKRKSYTL